MTLAAGVANGRPCLRNARPRSASKFEPSSQRLHQRDGRHFTLHRRTTTSTCGLLLQNLLPVVRGKHAAVDDGDVGREPPYAPRNGRDDGVCRSRAGVADEKTVRCVLDDARDDGVFTQVDAVCVEQRDVMPRVDERPADTQAAPAAGGARQARGCRWRGAAG